MTGLHDDPARVTLKGDPDDNEADRAEYPAARPVFQEEYHASDYRP